MTVQVSQADQRDLAEVFRALSDPTRLAIYEMVRAAGKEREVAGNLRNTVSEIARGFDISLSTVSHHLRELRRVGLIRCERRGQHVFCSIDSGVLEDLATFLGGSPVVASRSKRQA